MSFIARRPIRSRRGVTLIEMLVTVALLILIMTIIVQIFGSATGAMSASRAFQELDQGLRRLDSTIRNDLRGVTARFTPPLDPKDNLGYFEYSENAFADAQGEDGDDTLRFTTKAPDGQPFTGRMVVSPLTQPILITSQYAEVIYFLRGDRLYRRVFLIAPERQRSVSYGPEAKGGYRDSAGNLSSWLSRNDLSARPPHLVGSAVLPPVLNTLAALTNRENRAFAPRFYPDPNGNSIIDESPVDGVPDDYPTLYSTANPQLRAFPYIYPGAYSRPDPDSVGSAQGWIHSLDPSPTNPTFNHSPLTQGDSLAVPGTAGTQTLWGLPTWRETYAQGWEDPYPTPPSAGSKQQPPGLKPYNPSATTNAGGPLLPPVSTLNQPFRDGAGTTTFALASPAGDAVWEDDLIMTGVRSFDIKAYDNAFAGYVDLGWGDDIGNPAVYNPSYYNALGDKPTVPPYIVSNTTSILWPFNSGLSHNLLTQTFAHEGRMPPTVADGRFDPQAAGYGFAMNVGDDSTAVIRLRRVWDSWSTDYTQAPATRFVSTTGASTPAGGLPFEAPDPRFFPRSFPPPYPAALRGIQIQIRVVDPRNEHVKVLTIRQDFSDKL